MERKRWLTIFLHLADSGAAAVDFRKRLRLKTNVLSNHIKQLDRYRKELAALILEEKLLHEQRVKTQEDAARAAREVQRASSEIFGRNSTEGLDEGTERDGDRDADEDTSTGDNPQAMGTREDSDEDR